MQEQSLNRVLDLGCGSGRHVVYLARHDFAVHGLDNSPTAIEMTAKWLSEEGLQAELYTQEMTSRFPFPDLYFDAILSVQVIHHADTTSIAWIVGEMERVLRPGGFVFITVPKRRNQGKRFRQIEPNTYVPLDGAEKGLPHHYFTPQELRERFAQFEVADIHLDPVDHYCMSAYKR